jgi:chromosome segregation ATPase
MNPNQNATNPTPTPQGTADWQARAASAETYLTLALDRVAFVEAERDATRAALQSSQAQAAHLARRLQAADTSLAQARRWAARDAADVARLQAAGAQEKDALQAAHAEEREAVAAAHAAEVGRLQAALGAERAARQAERRARKKAEKGRKEEAKLRAEEVDELLDELDWLDERIETLQFVLHEVGEERGEMEARAERAEGEVVRLREAAWAEFMAAQAEALAEAEGAGPVPPAPPPSPVEHGVDIAQDLARRQDTWNGYAIKVNLPKQSFN